MRTFAPACLLLLSTEACAQPVPEFGPTVHASFSLPLSMGNPVFNSLTSTLGQVDLAFNLPVYKGLGVGAGANGMWYDLNGTTFSPVVTEGSADRWAYYGKLWWGRYTGPHTFYELNAKLGMGTWNWKCTTCAANAKQAGFHWSVNAAYFVHASENLAFSLLLGYQGDASGFHPGVIGLERFPGRTDSGAPYRFLTVGLGVSTGFKRSPPETGW